MSNAVLLNDILNGIVHNNLGTVLEEHGYEVTKSTSKSTEWSLIENQNETELPEQVLQVTYVDGRIRFVRFPGNYKSLDFKNVLVQDESIKEIKCTKNNIIYKR